MIIADIVAARGLRYDAEAGLPAVGASLWEQVRDGVVRDRVSGDGWQAGRITGGSRTASSVEKRGAITITRTVSVSTPQRSRELGYLAITLPRRLPHMVLDAKTNGRGMLARPASGQTLSLEGDLDSHFRLYVPTGYERDALYVFAPDLLAQLIDEAGDLDVEVRENQLIVYWPGGFDLTDARLWDRFDRIRATVGAKAWNQTDMYVDDRATPPDLVFEGAVDNDVAPEGRRLRRRVAPAVWLLAAIGVVAILFAGTIVTIVLTAVLR